MSDLTRKDLKAIIDKATVLADCNAGFWRRGYLALADAAENLDCAEARCDGKPLVHCKEGE